MLGVMTPYTEVSFQTGELDHGIICEGPGASGGLVALYNMCAIQYTGKVASLGAVTEDYLIGFIALTLQDIISRGGVERDIVVSILNELKAHRDLVVRPVLNGPQDFIITASYYLFTLLGIRLLHGWVLDPEASLYESVRFFTRDDLLQYRSSIEDQETQTENLALVQSLMHASDHQLTEYGFQSLCPEVAENGFAVVFCYGRFDVVHRHEGKLFILETSLVARNEFPGVVWKFFDGGDLEDSILLTKEYSLVAGQQNFEEKVTKWARAMFRDESNETSSNKGYMTKTQKRKAQRKKAKENKKNANASSDGDSYADGEQSKVSLGKLIKEDSEKDEGHGMKPAAEKKDPQVTTDDADADADKAVDPASEVEVTARKLIKEDSEKDEGRNMQPAAEIKEPQVTADDADADKAVDPASEVKVTAGVVAKDDNKSEDSQGAKNKENKPGCSAQMKMTAEENDKILKNLSLEPEETRFAPPKGIDCFPVAPAQSQSSDVSNFLNFLRGYKHDGLNSYFRGIVEAFKETHSPWFFVPYEFIIQHDEILALKIQDHYSSISVDLKEAVVQYLQEHKVTFPDVHLHILGLPKPRSVQTFEDYVKTIVLVEAYDVYGAGLDESPSFDGRRMALGYLHCILEKFKTGRCWGGAWDEVNMRVNDGSVFVIHCTTDMELTPENGILDLLNYSKTVLQRFKTADGKLPPYFEEFDIDCLQFPDPKDQVKWERFLQLIGSPFALKHPLVRSAFVCNSYLVANGHTSGEPPRYMLLFHRKGCQDWRPPAQKDPLFNKVFGHNQGPRPRVLKTRYLLDPWGITHWSVVKYSRHFIQHVLRYTKGLDLVQQINDIAVVDILLSRRLGKYIANFVRFLVMECGVDGLFSTPWRHFVASDCTDRLHGNIGQNDASTIDEMLSNVSEEIVAVAYAEVGVPSVAVELHKSTFICDADLVDFSSVLKRNSLMCKVIDADLIEVECQATLDGVPQFIKVSRYYSQDSQEATDSPSVIAVEGPYCEEYHFVFELLGVWLGL